MNRLPIERIGPGWGNSIVSVHKRAFPKSSIEQTIVGCSGASRYFDMLLAFPDFQHDHLILGAMEDEQLVGYAHGRRLEESWHLNYVAVAPERAGTGIGAALFDSWAEEAGRRELCRLSLDVELNNTLALEWYRRRGFTETGRTWTRRRPLGKAAGSTDVRIELIGWDAAEAWQYSYGFSSFGLRCADRTWTVGRLGDCFFRAFARLPNWLEVVLAVLNPERELLTLLDIPADESVGQLVSESVRMEMDVG